jgi:hypothetical protein
VDIKRRSRTDRDFDKKFSAFCSIRGKREVIKSTTATTTTTTTNKFTRAT